MVVFRERGVASRLKFLDAGIAGLGANKLGIERQKHMHGIIRAS